MAGDWIKMRADLATSPKVVRIASALRADRLRVIGGLHAVWCLFDTHSTDGQLDGYNAEALDDLIAFPGFAAAMVSVEWLAETDAGLSTPRFDEHNGQSAKRRCAESERKREARKVSAPDADKVRSREEKRREEKKKQDQERAAAPSPQKKTTPVLDHAFLIDQGVTAQHAADWLKARKSPLTQTAWDAVAREAEKAGITPAAAVQVCAENSWRGFRADWYANSGAGNGSQNQASQRVDNSAVGQVKRAIAEREAADREAGAVTHGQAGAENVRDIRPPLDGEFRRVV